MLSRLNIEEGANYCIVKFFPILLLAAGALAKIKTLNIEGNCIGGIDCTDFMREKIRSDIAAKCPTLTNRSDGEIRGGGFDGDGFHFLFYCGCWNDLTAPPPDTISGDFYSAQVTVGGGCS